MLVFAALLNFALAVLHVYIIARGAPAYRFFGAGERMARAAERGSWIPALVTAAIALVFFVWGLYAVSGANLIPALPWTRAVLTLIAGVFLLRGAGLIAPLFGVKTDAFLMVTSLVSLGIGLVHVLGLLAIGA